MSQADVGSLSGKRKRRGMVKVPAITLAHGGGGKAMHDLIDDVFVGAFDNDALAPLEDQARFALADLAVHGDRLAFTTDSFVVSPLEFPGGDIGKLAMCGTVNDLAVGGAKPLYLTCSVIIEEGLEVSTLRKMVASMATTAHEAGVKIVTGDTKVVERGACDKLFINTAGATCSTRPAPPPSTSRSPPRPSAGPDGPAGREAIWALISCSTFTSSTELAA